MGQKGRNERKQQREKRSQDKGHEGEIEEGGGADEEGGEIYNSADTGVGAFALASKEVIRCLEDATHKVLVYCCGNVVLAADLNKGDLLELEQPHTEQIRCLAFSQGAGVVATAADDKTVVLRSFPSMKVKATGTSDRKAVAICFDAAAQDIILAEKSGEVLSKRLDALSGPSKYVLGHISSLTDMVMTKDGKFVLTSDRDEKVKISHYPAASVIEGFCLGHSELVTCLSVMPLRDGSHGLLTGSADGSIRVWKVPSGDLQDTLQVVEEEAGEQAGVEEGTEGGEGKDGEKDGERQAQDGAEGGAAKGEEGGGRHVRQKWDDSAAGKAQRTAMLAARMRHHSTMPCIVHVVHSPSSGLIACAVEKRNYIVLACLQEGNQIKRVCNIPTEGAPVGLCFMEGTGKDELIVAATPNGSNPISVFRVTGEGDAAAAEPVELEQAHADVIIRGIWVVSDAARKAGKCCTAPAEVGGSGPVKKKRRHADPEWPGHKN